ncbi:MAG: hypothetical protein V6Z86_00660 [Hyphomicrobiales bacterium]
MTPALQGRVVFEKNPNVFEFFLSNVGRFLSMMDIVKYAGMQIVDARPAYFRTVSFQAYR